ncbi:hypothetical protein tb265_24830 [Gemmatimonadetes bacterium T265]|nr:hypothetical protein tb265_24830 [Gemmatimonadetes bacterium T265]
MLERPVRCETLADDVLRARMAARGTPGYVTDLVLGLYVASRAGEFAAVDPTLEQRLGRRPTAMRDVIAEEIRT